MSSIEPPNWTWNLTTIEDMGITEMKFIIWNRNPEDKGSKFCSTGSSLKDYVKKHYKVDDYVDFKQLTDERKKVELALRGLCTYGSPKNYLNSLTLNTLPCSDLLVYGYIHRSERRFTLNVAIPKYLIELVLKFNQSRVISFYVSSEYPDNIFIANINNKQKSKFEIIGDKIPFDQKGGAVHSSKCILPSAIKDKVNAFRTYNEPWYHLLFQLNDNKTTSVFAMNTLQFVINTANLSKEAIQIKLADFPVSTSKHAKGKAEFIIYDEDENLLMASLTTEGYLSNGSHFKTLSLGSTGSKWENKSNIPGQYPSVTFVKTNGNKKTLFATSYCRSKYDTGTYLYDSNDDIWNKSTRMKFKVAEPGIFYDEIKDCVYVGGGRDPSNSEAGIRTPHRVQTFDLKKEKWTVCKHLTIMKHEEDVRLWTDPGDPRILYIGSMQQNGLEFYDLRNNKPWKAVCVPNHTQSLRATIGVAFDNPCEPWKSGQRSAKKLYRWTISEPFQLKK